MTQNTARQDTGPCPLCDSPAAQLIARDDQRGYFRCPVCDLIFVAAQDHLSPDAEKSVYDHHENDVADLRYRHFLNRLFEPVASLLAPGSSGLDFGCGPGPALAAMFREAGHEMAVYDRYYADNKSVFEQVYDFIVSTEVFEHLQHPRQEIERLWKSLRPGGVLGVMTKRLNNRQKFTGWFYTADPTHIAYFSDRTFAWTAGWLDAELSLVCDDVILLKKSCD